MASLMENLIDVLHKECKEYELLLELSQRKTPIIISGKLEELQKITDDEQALVGRINRLEHEREEVTADIANVVNRDVTKLKLSDLIDMLAARPEEQRLLAQAHDRLRTAVRSLQKINEQNQSLITNALEMVEFEMNLIQSMKSAPATANYNRGAYNAGSTMGVTGNGFDTKQ